jgi:hypothetical protein
MGLEYVGWTGGGARVELPLWELGWTSFRWVVA